LRLRRIADIRYDAGDLESARVAWQRSYDVLEQLGHPDGADVLAKLEKHKSQ
jgi:hypothetical protein